MIQCAVAFVRPLAHLILNFFSGHAFTAMASRPMCGGWRGFSVLGGPLPTAHTPTHIAQHTTHNIQIRSRFRVLRSRTTRPNRRDPASDRRRGTGLRGLHSTPAREPQRHDVCDCGTSWTSTCPHGQLSLDSEHGTFPRWRRQTRLPRGHWNGDLFDQGVHHHGEQ